MGPLRRSLVAAVCAGALLLSGCSAVDTAPPAPSSGSSGASSSDAGLTPTALSVPKGMSGGNFATARTLNAPRGWTVSVWTRLDSARLEAWTPDGRLLVSRPEHGDIIALTPSRKGAAPARSTLIDSLDQPHGMAFRGTTLYVAESDQIDSFHYAAGRVSDRKIVVDGLPDAKSPDLGGAYAHALKSVVVGRDGALYFSVGSTANVSPQDRSASPERATILTVAPGASTATVYAQGVRNGTGLAIDPAGAVWTAVNDRDQTPYPYDRDYGGDGSTDRGRVMTRYVNDHPLEMVAKLSPGRDLGWPYCNPDPDVTPGAASTRLDFSNRPFVRDEQTNANGSKLDCAALPRVEQGLPAHSAPLGMSFTTGSGLPGLGQGAMIGVHGSWNRTPPQAPQVWFLPWNTGTLRAPRPLLTGFQNADGSRWGRTVAAVEGPDGAVYVSDDTAGAIYRMAPPTG